MVAEVFTELTSSDGGQQMLGLRAALLDRKQCFLISIQTLTPRGITLILRAKYITLIFFPEKDSSLMLKSYLNLFSLPISPHWLLGSLALFEATIIFQALSKYYPFSPYMSLGIFSSKQF